VELEPDQRAAVVTLQNNGVEPVLVQVQTFAWNDSTATAALVPTREIVAVPPVATIEAGAKQLIRVAVRGEARTDVEAAYRLVITEVPPATVGPPAGVRFALRLSLPVFVAPPGAAAQPLWSVEASEQGPRLVLANQGTAHLQVRRIQVLGRDEVQVLHKVEEPAYVLPGRRHAWPLPSGLPTALTLKVETDFGPLEATVAAPSR
jgi:fimbrial chaperone protein